MLCYAAAVFASFFFHAWSPVCINYDDFHIVKKTAVATCDKVSVCLSVSLSVCLVTSEAL